MIIAGSTDRLNLDDEETQHMKINTRLFGELEISDEKIISFPAGLPGFEQLKRFAVVIFEQTRPFYWLLSVDEDIALPVISPFDIDTNYSPTVDDDDMDDLRLESEEDLMVLVVSVIPDELIQMTANMAAPILINTKTNIGCQVLIESDDYSSRTPIFDAISKTVMEVDEHAGSDKTEE